MAPQKMLNKWELHAGCIFPIKEVEIFGPVSGHQLKSHKNEDKQTINIVLRPHRPYGEKCVGR